jgi:3'-5' exoribonuclease
MPPLGIQAIRRETATQAITCELHAQVESCTLKTTRDGKPFCELNLVDSAGRLTLRAWNDHPQFEEIQGLTSAAFVCIAGEFSANGAYGLEAKRWQIRPLTHEEMDLLLGGPDELRQKQDADAEYIEATARSLRDPRLKLVALQFLAEYGSRLRRTAAARNYHHARRGGLVEHVAQMMRTAEAVAAAYPALNRDLLLAGVLFHDAGKLWENAMEEKGFGMPYTERGELLGHIPVGIELVNTLWRKVLTLPEAADWPSLHPASEQVRLHLLHLVAAHHGALEFGSPVVPKTPEAWALHHIDNLDAKLEMMFQGYHTASSIAPGIQERVRPLPGNLVSPLPHFTNPGGSSSTPETTC